MRKSITAAATFLIVTGLAHAATINAGTNWEAVDLGTSAETGQFAVTVSADGNDWLYTWTKTGDLDGLGVANDTLSFKLRSSAYNGSSYSSVTGTVTLGTAFDYSVGGTVTTPADQHFGPDYDIDTNQSFQLRIENIVFTQGEALGWVATFDGFKAMGIFAAPTGSDTFYLGTVGAQTVMPTAADYTFSPPRQVLTVTSAQNNKRIRDIDFSFTAAAAVPEPSMSALLLGSLAMIALIRRRQA